MGRPKLCNPCCGAGGAGASSSSSRRPTVTGCLGDCNKVFSASYDVTIADLTNSTCTGCPPVNGTWTIVSGGTCTAGPPEVAPTIWAKETGVSITCAGISRAVCVFMTCSSGPDFMNVFINVQGLCQRLYRLACSSFDPLGSNTFSFHNPGGAICTGVCNWPATITVAAA